MIEEMVESCQETVDYYLHDRGIWVISLAILALMVRGPVTMGWYLLGIYLSMMLIATHKTVKKIRR